MEHLEEIADRVREDLDIQNDARDKALIQARKLTRHCAHAIRAVHRLDREGAEKLLAQADEIANALTTSLKENHANLYFSGYTQDALKEYAEARIVCALVENEALPTPEDLNLESATYLKGLAEAVGELRRRTMDILRGGHSEEAELMLQHMDEIFAVLVTMDYPDAVTHGLRRQTDITRGIIERTRGDITLSFRQQQLEKTIRQAEENILTNNDEAH
jgi:translin